MSKSLMFLSPMAWIVKNCSGAQGETLEEAAKGHGVDLNDLIEALNKV